MMSKIDAARKAIVDSLAEKIMSDALTWEPTSTPFSYQTVLDQYKIHLDKKSASDAVEYVIWLFAPGAVVLDRFSDRSLRNYKPENNNFNSYSELISRLFDIVSDNRKLSDLSDLISKLKNKQ